MSDNFPFYQEYEIPAHTISTFDFKNFNYFHKPGDEIDKLEITNMNSIINHISLAILKLSNENTKILIAKE